MKISVHPVRRGTLGTVAGVVAAIISTSALAQELEEVTVTATRRSENIQDVPIAVTAITAAQLETKGINDVAKLSAIAPNVTLDAGTPFSGSDTVLSAFIRGIGQNDFAFNQDPGVGVYVDGVYLARSVGSNTTMLDVDRVEILKGPQGTLFGRNTIGGAISIVTRDPGDEFRFKGELTTGDFNRLDFRGSADLPITDKLLTSISFSTARRDGYQRRIPFPTLLNPAGTAANPLAGIPDCGATGATCSWTTDDSSRFPAAAHQTSDREGGIDQWATRAKAVYLASDTFKITLAADYMNVDQSASPNTALAITTNGINPVTGQPIPNGTLGQLYNACLLGAPIGVVCSLPRGGLSPTPTPMAQLPPLSGLNVNGNPNDDRIPYSSIFETGNIDTTYATGNSFSKLKNEGVAATLLWTLPNESSIKSITAYRDLHWKTGLDLDGSPEPILEPSFDMVQHETSEELQWTGKAISDRLNYTVGGYYFKEGGHLHDYVVFPAGLLMIDGPNDLDTKAYAGYLHLNFKITEKLGVTAGARYTKEKKHFEGHQTDDNGLSYKASGCYPPSASGALLGAPANLTCQQVLGFPSATEPFRYYPPGVNTLDFSNTSPTFGVDYHFTPDLMLYASYSKGYKTGSWTTRLSSPHPTYDDSLHFDPEKATAEEVGFKSELFNHTLRLNLAAFHTKYENIQLNSQQGISPTLVNAGDAKIYGAEAEAEAAIGGGFSINAAFGYTKAEYTRIAPGVGDNGVNVDTSFLLPKTPKYKFYIGPQYIANLPNEASLVLNADYTYTDKLANDLGNTALLIRDSTNIVNASVTYRAPDDKWELALGGTNLSDERYIVSGQNQGGVAVIDAVYSRPREWFATIRMNLK